MSSLDRPALPARIADSGVVAVLRTTNTRHLLKVADSLVESGLAGLEVTFTVPSAETWVQRLSSRYADGLVVGAGTVLDHRQACSAIDAGASFIVSAAYDPDVLNVSRAAGVPYVPGALSPTEIWNAWRSGASAVKLFPAGMLNPSLLPTIRGPFPEIPLMPTGGISPAEAPSWIRAGAVAVGIGDPLVGAALDDGDTAGIPATVHRLLDDIAAVRGHAVP